MDVQRVRQDGLHLGFGEAMLATPQSRAVLETRRQQQVIEVLRRMARQLDNTLTVCRESPVHPAVVDRFLEGTLVEELSVGRTV